jgi:hypothetical protein
MTDGSNNGKDNGKSKGRSVRERKIDNIRADLKKALTAERENIFVIGALLVEAKGKVPHGDWLPWLERNFGRSVSTAENYMGAAQLLAKIPTVGNLKLTPGAIYWLAREHTGLFEEEVYEQVEARILKLAEKQWVRQTGCEDTLIVAVNAAAKRQREREEVPPTPDEPAPDEPTRQGPQLVSSDGVSTSTPDEPEEEPEEEDSSPTPEEIERELDQAFKLKLQSRFRSAVRMINDELIGHPRADLKGAGADVDDWNKKLEKAANFLISFVDTPNKKARGVVELQRAQIEKQQVEIEKLRDRDDEDEVFLSDVEQWLAERDKLALLDDEQEQEAPADAPKWDYEQLRELVTARRTTREEEKVEDAPS